LQGWEMVDNKLCQCYGHFNVPSDWASGNVSITPVIIPNANGNVYPQIAADWGAVGEAYNTHSDSDGYSQINVVQSQIEVDATVALSIAVAAGDVISVVYRRDGAHLSDTVGATVYFIGFYVSYTADM